MNLDGYLSSIFQSRFHWYCLISVKLIYLFKVNNRNIRKRCEICSNITLRTPERHQWRRSSVFIVNFQYISHLFLAFLLFKVSRFHFGHFNPFQSSVAFHIETSHLFGQNCVKMFLNDIFLTISKCQLCNYANRNAFYTLGRI